MRPHQEKLGSQLTRWLLATALLPIAASAATQDDPLGAIVPRILEMPKSAGAAGSDNLLALELMVNGRSTGSIGEFTERDGALYAKRSELKELGFRVPDDLAGGVDPIPLTALPGVAARLDQAHQRLIVTAAESALLPNVLGQTGGIRLVPLSEAGWGAVLSHDTLATYVAGTATGGSLADARAFSPYGLLRDTALAVFTPVQQAISSALRQRSLLRLDTVYSYSEESELRRWNAGDVISGALAWSRAVRLGGVQVARDFSLRPDLITYPFPTISSSAAVPTSVDVFVNGVRQFSEQVQPGPFAVRTLPLVTGAGEVTVATTDALGRQVFTTLPFYTATQLLKPGLASYSLEAGSVRQLYGIVGDRYVGTAGSASLRYGVTDWLTAESHGEGTEGLGLLGLGAGAQIGNFGLANLALAGSAGHGRPPFGLLPGAPRGRGQGGLAALSLQRQSRGFSATLSGQVTSSGYRDIAAVNGAPVPRLNLTASIGVPLGRFGGFGVALTQQHGGRQSAFTTPGNTGLSLFIPGALNTTIATATYSVSLAERLGFYTTSFATLRGRRSYGAAFGITYYFGNNTSAVAGVNFDKTRPTGEIAAQKTAFEIDDWGFRLRDAEGYSRSREVEGEYLSRYGRVVGGVAQASGSTAVRAGYRGAVAYAGGHFLVSDAIPDAFAVVKTGDIGGVPVLSQNRPYGKTNSAGVLLVPNLLSYQNNILAIDPLALPADVEVGRSRAVVRPPDHAGVVVDFAVRRVNAALLKLRDRAGEPLPLGSAARLEGGRQEPVGFDGETYLTGLKPHNRLEVRRPDGKRCAVEFDYEARPGDIPVIPLTCIDQ